jgi:hypothetical protein
MFPVRPLRSTVITRFPATMSLSDSRPEPPSGYVFPHEVGLFRSAGPPRFLGRSFHARCPLSPRRVRRLLAPISSPPIAGFRILGRLATPTLCHEAEPGSLALRLACSPREASPAGLLLLTLTWLIVERAINNVYSFQYTRSARLVLAHLSSRSRTKKRLCGPSCLCVFVARLLLKGKINVNCDHSPR